MNASRHCPVLSLPSLALSLPALAVPPKWDEQRGLRAEYYKKRRFSPQDRVLSRLDPEVRFDFGTASPIADKIEPHEFSIRWAGSVLAPETGEYELVIRTEHAAR